MSGVLGKITPGARLVTPDGVGRYAGLLIYDDRAPRILAQLGHNDPLTGLPLVKAYPIEVIKRREADERPLR